MTGQCGAGRSSPRWFPGKQVPTCDEPSVTVIEAGCIHEHVVTIEVCGTHKAGLLSGAARCGPCWYGPEPHRCPQVGREVIAA